MKKKGFALFTALIMVMQCFVGVPFTGFHTGVEVTASAAEYENGSVSAVDAGMVIDELSILLNGQPLENGDSVRTGDKLYLDFHWTLPENYTFVKGTFYVDLNDKLNGVDLGDQDILVGDIARYYVRDNVLYIQLLQGASERNGYCSLEGTLDLDGVETDENGGFELNFGGAVVDVVAPEKVPGLWVDKKRNGDVYTDGTDYFQKFYIDIGSNNQASNNVWLSDTYDDIFTEVVDVKWSDGTYADVYQDPGTNMFSVFVGTVESGDTNKKTLEYTMKLDKEKLLADTLPTTDRENTATVNRDFDVDTTKSDTDRYNVSLPTVQKSGAYDNDTGKATWTVTVYPNIYGEADFTLVDVPSAYIEQQVKDIIGEALNLTDKMVWNADKKCYEYSYTVDIPEEVINSKTGTKVENSAVISYDEVDGVPVDYTTNGDGHVYIPGKLQGFVDKSFTGPDADGMIEWTYEVRVPANTGVTKVEIQDSMYMGDYRNLQKYNHSGLVVFDYSTINLEILVDGVPQNYGFLSELSSNIDIGARDPITGGVTDIVGRVGNVDSSGFYFSFFDKGGWYDYISGGGTTNFLSDNSDKDIAFRVKIKSTCPDEVLYESNGIEATLLDALGGSVKEGVKVHYEKEFDASKSVWPGGWYINGGVVEGKNVLGWMVDVTSTKFKVGDKIVITDTLPEGYEYHPNSCMLSPANADSGVWNTMQYAPYITADASAEGKVTFEVTVSQKILDDLQSNTMHIVYLTRMTDEGYNEFCYNHRDQDYTNSAKVDVYSENGDEKYTGDCAFTQTVKFKPEDVVTKRITSSGVDGDAAKMLASYEVVINTAEMPLNGGENLTAVDTLGSNLRLYGTPEITPDATFSYDKSTNKLSFSDLLDNTRYVIRYTVEVKTIGKSEEISDSEIVEKFGNNIDVTVSGGDAINSSATIAEGTFRSEGDYEFDEEAASITIKGSKIWSNEGIHGAARPSKIIISLKKTATDSEDKVTETTVKYEVDATVTDDDGNWSYTIENLTTKSSDGTTYVYTVTEVTVDGYNVTYSVSNENIGNGMDNGDEYSLDIKNSFSAAETEKRNLVVTKSWVGDSVGDRPAQLKINLKDTLGNDFGTKIIDSENLSVMFENLPLYVYSRDAEDNLVRTPRTYVLAESVDAAYAEQLAGYIQTNPGEFDLVTLAGGEALSSNAAKTIINTLKTPETVETTETSETDETASTTETGETGETAETASTAETGETGETAETVATTETGETGETAETATTAETGETAETAETGEVSETGETDETAETAETSETTETSDVEETKETEETKDDDDDYVPPYIPPRYDPIPIPDDTDETEETSEEALDTAESEESKEETDDTVTEESKDDVAPPSDDETEEIPDVSVGEETDDTSEPDTDEPEQGSSSISPDLIPEIDTDSDDVNPDTRGNSTIPMALAALATSAAVACTIIRRRKD